MRIDGGLILLRNFPNHSQKWYYLNSSGKWLFGMSVAVDYVMRGEGEVDDISLDEARALAAKLGSSLEASWDDAQVERNTKAAAEEDPELRDLIEMERQDEAESGA